MTIAQPFALCNQSFHCSAAISQALKIGNLAGVFTAVLFANLCSAWQAAAIELTWGGVSNLLIHPGRGRQILSALTPRTAAN